MDFTGKTALVTGAAVGIGRAAAHELARQGANVILVDYNAETLETVRGELAAYAERIRTIRCDVSDEAAVRAAAAEGLAAFGAIDILVNNAALWRCKSSFIDTPMADWKRFIDVNVMGTVYFTHAVLPGMLERGWGRVINIASVAGVYGNANMVHYSATKGAVIAFTRALAKEVTDKGVLVNAISPGSVSSSADPDMDAFTPSALSFMGRTGTDRENANLICFLAGDEASYISGQNIQIDGCRKKQ